MPPTGTFKTFAPGFVDSNCCCTTSVKVEPDMKLALHHCDAAGFCSYFRSFPASAKPVLLDFSKLLLAMAMQYTKQAWVYYPVIQYHGIEFKF